jgi:hypothetical protein
MVVVPLSQPRKDDESPLPAPKEDSLNVTRIAAGAALIAGGVLFLTGSRRAGVLAATSGTALALLDQQSTVRSWWQKLPRYIDDVQRLLADVQGAVDDVAVKRERLRKVFVKQ